ncbi:MAG: hypothetical protein IMY68_08965, partial [Bacteroidetes bacterium]|nr:hypothetical protein [Bacteroidota bacterium]
MIPVHREYTVEIKKLKFESDHGIRYSQTALINFRISDKVPPLLELMGHMEEKDIYKSIERGEAVNLDHCYVDKFSLRDYRLLRNLDP